MYVFENQQRQIKRFMYEKQYHILNGDASKEQFPENIKCTCSLISKMLCFYALFFRV